MRKRFAADGDRVTDRLAVLQQEAFLQQRALALKKRLGRFGRAGLDLAVERIISLQRAHLGQPRAAGPWETGSWKPAGFRGPCRWPRVTPTNCPASGIERLAGLDDQIPRRRGCAPGRGWRAGGSTRPSAMATSAATPERERGGEYQEPSPGTSAIAPGHPPDPGIEQGQGPGGRMGGRGRGHGKERPTTETNPGRTISRRGGAGEIVKVGMPLRRAP